MGAKGYLMVGAALACASMLGGCEFARRLAPPGFVKFEDIAKGEPVDPAIAERIATRRRPGEASYPELSDTPSTKPQKATAAERDAALAELSAERDRLNAAVDADRGAAAADRAAADAEILGARDALESEVEALKAVIARERQDTPR